MTTENPAKPVNPGEKPPTPARRARFLVRATAVAFLVSCLFPLAAGLSKDTASFPRWWGAADVWKVGGKVFAIGRWDEAGQAFITFKAGDIAGLTDALEALLQSSDLRQRMGQASRDLIAGWSYEECRRGLLAALAGTRDRRGYG